MKKRALCLLIICAVALSGCGKSSDVPAEETPAPTEAPTATPEPTPSPAPVPTVDVADYEYFLVTNTTLGVMFKYPTHWINKPGRSTISYNEPVNPGETACRVAVTSKLLSEKPTSREVRLQLDSFVDQIKIAYPDYTEGDIEEDVEVMGATGLTLQYNARDPETGEGITGFVVMCYQKDTRRLYLMHFTAPSRRFTEMRPVLQEIQNSLSVP